MVSRNHVLLVTVLLLLGTLSLSSGSSAQQSQASKESKEVETIIDDMAKDLAALLTHPGIRNKLRVHVKKSSKREQIIFLDEFMADAVKEKGLPDQAKGRAKGLLDKSKGAKKRFSETNLKQVVVSPEIDVYFPVRDHRAKWTGGDDVLVAAGVIGDDHKQIKAYSAKTQEVIYISGDQPPAQPVIIVAPCEHESHEAQPVLKVGEVPQSKSAPPPEGEQSYTLVNYFKITDDKEPWYAGDPEIYVILGQRRAGSVFGSPKIHLKGQPARFLYTPSS